MTQDPWVLALTGSMLSGKSTALDFFRENGASVLSADVVVEQLYQQEYVRQKLKKLLGTADKKKIAKIVFQDENERQQLEQSLHPLVLKHIRSFIKQAQTGLVVLEIPLLFEAGWDNLFDLVIVVASDPQTLPSRLADRGFTPEEYESRISHQWPEEKKIQAADLVLFHKNKIDLKTKINRLCQTLACLRKVRS